MNARRLLITTVVITFSLFVSTLQILRIPLTACEIETFVPNQLLSGFTAPVGLLSLWQQAASGNPYAGRMITLLIAAITLATIYRLSTALCEAKVAVWTVIVCGVLSVSVILLRGSTLYSWILLLGSFATLTFYLGMKQRKYFLLYLPTIVCLIGIHPIGLSLLLGHGLYYAVKPLRQWRSSPVCLWLLLPLITLFDKSIDPLVVLSIIIIPLIVLAVHVASIFNLRTQIAVGILLIVAGLSPSYTVVGEQIMNDIGQQSNANYAGFPVLVNRPASCLVPDDIAATFFKTGRAAYIYDTKVSHWVTIDRNQVGIVEELPSAVTASEGLWKIAETEDSDETRTLLFQQDYVDRIHLSLYFKAAPQNVPADTPPVYRIGTLAILKFNLLPGTQVRPGSTVLVYSWWTNTGSSDDNYILDMNLVDSSGQPIASHKGLIANSYTQNWNVGDVYQDERALKIPNTITPGSYNLVISLHGSSNTTNAPITLNDNSPVGNYGYLTSVQIAP